MLQGVPDGLARVSGFAKAADDRDVPSGQFGDHSHSVQREPRAPPAPVGPAPKHRHNGPVRGLPYFILSDTGDPVIAIEEEALAEAFAAEAGSRRLVYRHRMDNTDYKAGNIHDFGQ